MSKTVITNMTMEGLRSIMKLHSDGVFITNVERIGNNYTITLSDSCNIEILQEMAFKDYLSGAYNRRYFIEQLDIRAAEYKRNKNPFGIVMLDLDDFTKINNVYGHEAGDVVIQHTAQALEKTFKRKSDIIARLGGDEFIVLLSAIGQNTAPEKICTKICNKLINEITSPVNIGSSVISITASIGVAFTSVFDENVHPDELGKIILRRADEAMYETKNKEKCTYSIYSDNKNNKRNNNVYKTNNGN